MDDGEYFLFFVLVLRVGFEPVDEYGFDTTAWLCFEDEGFVGIGVIIDKIGYFMEILFLSWEEGFLLVILDGGEGGAKNVRRITQCSWCTYRRGIFFSWGE